jgi:hypothetical protein
MRLYYRSQCITLRVCRFAPFLPGPLFLISELQELAFQSPEFLPMEMFDPWMRTESPVPLALELLPNVNLCDQSTGDYILLSVLIGGIVDEDFPECHIVRLSRPKDSANVVD